MSDAPNSRAAGYEVCGFVRSQWLPQQTGIVVAHRGGIGRLQIACGPFDISSSLSGDLSRREECLIFDHQPLIRLQGTECPTCPRLLQAGLGGDVSSAVAGIVEITVDQWNRDPVDCAKRLEPVIRLLPAYTYRISLRAHAPTDGNGQLFWKPSAQLEQLDALSWFIETEPKFLAATQSTTKFDPAAYERAQRTHQNHPIVAIEISGGMSAILDGHHRALAAANAGRLVPTLVIAEWRPGSPDWPVDRSSSSGKFHSPADLGYQSRRLWCDVAWEQIDEYRQMINELSHPSLPSDCVPRHLDRVYPSVRAATGYTAIVATYGDITDQAVNDILKGRVESLALYRPESPFETLMHALFGRRDPRAIGIAHRILRDGELIHWWRDTVQCLSTWPCEEVDDIFVEYLCRSDEPERPDVVAVIDEYFRDRNQ